MKYWINQTARIIDLYEVDIYAVICLDFFLIIGVLLGRNMVLYSIIAPIILIVNVAILLTTIYTTNIFWTSSQKIKKYILATITLRLILLFAIPQVLADVFILQLVQILAVVTIEAASIYFFLKGFSSQVAPFLQFIDTKRIHMKNFFIALPSYTTSIISRIKLILSDKIQLLLSKRKSRILVHKF